MTCSIIAARKFRASKSFSIWCAVCRVINAMRWIETGRVWSCRCVQVIYACREYACTAIDVLARRLRLAFINVHAADEALPRVIEIMAREIGWSTQKQKACITPIGVVRGGTGRSPRAAPVKRAAHWGVKKILVYHSAYKKRYKKVQKLFVILNLK